MYINYRATYGIHTVFTSPKGPCSGQRRDGPQYTPPLTQRFQGNAAVPAAAGKGRRVVRPPEKNVNYLPTALVDELSVRAYAASAAASKSVSKTVKSVMTWHMLFSDIHSHALKYNVFSGVHSVPDFYNVHRYTPWRTDVQLIMWRQCTARVV